MGWWLQDVEVNILFLIFLSALWADFDCKYSILNSKLFLINLLSRTWPTSDPLVHLDVDSRHWNILFVFYFCLQISVIRGVLGTPAILEKVMILTFRTDIINLKTSFWWFISPTYRSDPNLIATWLEEDLEDWTHSRPLLSETLSF